MKNLVIAFLLLCIVIPCSAQKVTPALNLTAGETYYTINVVTSAISQNFKGQQMSYSVALSAKTAFKVIDIKDTVYNMEVTYKNIGMKMTTPQGVMDFNSGVKDTPDLPSQILTAMLNKPFLVAISKTGKVISVKNISEIMTAVFSSMGKVDSVQKTQLRGQFMQSFGEQAFKGNLEQTLAIYPGKSVSKGDKWVVNTLLESAMSAGITSVYQLQDVTDASYQIHGDGKITTFKNKKNMVSGMPATYDLTGTITSEIKADKKTGWVSEARLKEDIAGTFTIKDNPQLPGGAVIPMTIHSENISTDQ